MAIVFQAPGRGCAVLPWVSNVLGWPAASAYTPNANCWAVEERSR
ncbi:MAG TPA: hypothetical protein VN810_08220 [Terriglobales bacterium]|nr:hypothetical protein [Terriglobales bacterium]